MGINSFAGSGLNFIESLIQIRTDLSIVAYFSCDRSIALIGFYNSIGNKSMVLYGNQIIIIICGGAAGKSVT